MVGGKRRTENAMNETMSHWKKTILAELSEVIENLQIHHSRRDGDWLKPQDLRLILRLMYHLHIGEQDDAKE